MTGSWAALRIGIYARFSSDGQRDASIDDQVRRCKDHIRQQGGRPEVAQVFVDKAVSGASLARPGFERMMAAITGKERTLDLIVTEDMSRISRDFADSAVLFRQLRYLGVPMVGVADGIDTSKPNGKVQFAIKSLFSDLYLDELRDKTQRGLEGRARAGMSTGGVPYGYRSVPVVGPGGKPIGFRLEIDETRAAIVRRIFAEYLDGRSLVSIARGLNRDRIDSPRTGTRHKRLGWGASTIRVFLHQEKYVGLWVYRKTSWLKAPGTNKRIPRARDASERMQRTAPELQIVDQRTWDETQLRLRAVKRRYTEAADGQPKGRALSGKSSAYPLSGLLTCGVWARRWSSTAAHRRGSIAAARR